MRRAAARGGDPVGAAGARHSTHDQAFLTPEKGAGRDERAHDRASPEVECRVATFTVLGKPAPKQRPRVGANGKIYTPRATRAYEHQVAWTAKAAGLRPLAGPVEVRAAFYFAGKPPGDLDNYLKALLDGLKSVAYADDSQVVRLLAEVRGCATGEERAEVEVRPLAAKTAEGEVGC